MTFMRCKFRLTYAANIQPTLNSVNDDFQTAVFIPDFISNALQIVYVFIYFIDLWCDNRTFEHNIIRGEMRRTECDVNRDDYDERAEKK